jgi:tRNA 2-selenouridine synthase
MGAADGVAVIEEGMESRLDVLVEDYVIELGKRFEVIKGEELGKEEHAAYLREGLLRIQKKLGGARHAELAGIMEKALKEQRATGDTSLHRVWLAALLTEYYDPMYDYQMERGGREVLFKGDREGVIEWAAKAAKESMERRTM